MAKALMLKTCDSDGRAFGGYVWPDVGQVAEPKNWDSRPECGNGLHGLLWGEGDSDLFDWSQDAVWIVAEVDTDEIIDLGGKIKVPRALVVFRGDREGATRYLYENGGAGRAIAGLTLEVGDGETAVVGDYGVAKAGNRGTAIAGYGGCATAGDGGNASVGDCGTATAGHNGRATAGYDGNATVGDGGWAIVGQSGTAIAGDGGVAVVGAYGIAKAGDNGVASADNEGEAVAGDGGKASAGVRGRAVAGDRGRAEAGTCGVAKVGVDGIAIAGMYGKAAAGVGGIIKIRYRDGDEYRLAVGYIERDGLKPDIFYRFDEDVRCFVEAE